MRSEDTRPAGWGGFSVGMLMGAWHRRGGGGLQGRHVHRKFLCGSLSVGWQHFNAGLITIMDTRGEDTTKERTQHIVKHTMSDSD